MTEPRARDTQADTEVWVVVCGPGAGVLYASRPTRAEAEQVLDEQRGLAEKFGRPRVERRVAPLRPRPGP